MYYDLLELLLFEIKPTRILKLNKNAKYEPI